MPLSSGTRLGPYEIVSALGAGGMGEVYRARDTRLDRTVAIKVVAEWLAADPQLRERFDREARAISSLNHPHICALYDVGEAPNPDAAVFGGDTVRFLVLEYLEGETVAERLASGPLPMGDALRLGIEIADALHKAHRSGIVHRDLKPANVMLTKAGAKLLDFGLAKSAAPAVATSAHSMLPTTPPNLTAHGMILGTFQYMAPEQIEGLEADARTDIFAFGALLFEMLTGRTAFEGKTRASLLGAILKDQPDAVSRMQPLATAAVDRIIATCLAKDPDDRYQTARDLSRELQWAAAGAEDTLAPPAETTRAATRLPWLLTALLTTALTAIAFLAWPSFSQVTPAAAPVQFTIPPPENTFFGGPSGGGTGAATQVAISPDGLNVVVVAGGPGMFRIWIRPVGTLAMRAIPGTEGGTFPFWSADGRSIGFFADGKLKRVLVSGGPPQVLCEAPGGRGGTWNRDGVILFASGGTVPGIQRVSSAGGVPTAVTTLDLATGETHHRWPHFLPDGQHFLYTASTGTCCPPTKPAVIRIGSLDPTAPAITLLQAESSAIYASGHILFASAETLMARPFGPETLQLHGEAFPLAEHVSIEGSRYLGASVSENDTLVYAQGGAQVARQLTWFDRTGGVLETVGDAAQYNGIAYSRDGRWVAATRGEGTLENRDIWIIDIARDVSSRLTFDPGTDGSPVWSPDSTRIVYAGQRSGKISLRQQLIGGAVADELLFEGSGDVAPSDWSADEKFIAYVDRSSAASPDIWILPLFGDRKPFPFARTGFSEGQAMFSPDGRWIAYSSNDAGRGDVYVRSFPDTGRKHQISPGGGGQPVWRQDGKELFYLAPGGILMSAAIDMTGPFAAGVPQVVFPKGVPIFSRTGGGRLYAVSKDGKRFLADSGAQDSRVAPLTVIVNWTAAIEK